MPEGFPGLPEGWVSHPETFPTHEGGARLFGVLHEDSSWRNGPKLLLVLHGLGEHGGRYAHFPHYLRDTLSAVYTYDHRGHGRSEGLRGHAEKLDDLVQDAASVIERWDEKLRSKHGSSEIHLLGHSMGGLIALRLLLSKKGLPLRSATLSAPFLGLGTKMNPIKQAGAQALARIWGTLQLPTNLDAGGVSRDPKVVRAYLDDRLVHDRMTPKFFSEIMAAISETRAQRRGIEVPCQFLVPLQDRLVDAEATFAFARGLELKDKLVKSYPEFFHESFNETEKEIAFEDLRSWIQVHHA